MTDSPRAVARDQGNVAYDAFISYSHAADGKLAPALQNALQRFAKPWYRRRALHLFRDQTSLSASPGLWPSIEQALQSSRYFLLLASPEAAQSRWVQQEVAWWLEHKSPQTLLIALTDGTIAREEGAKDFDWDETEGTTALPPNLKGVFVETPLWVDFRWAQGQEHLSTKNPEFQNALAALSAPLRNIPKEDLIGEDVRQHRRALLLARGAALVLVILLIAAIWQWQVAQHQTTLAVRAQATAEAEEARAEEQARISLTRALVAQAMTETERREHERGALLARQAYLVDEANGSPVRNRVDAALRAVAAVPNFNHIFSGHELPVTDVAFAPDGRLLASAGEDGTVRLWDPTRPGAASTILEGHIGKVWSVAFAPDGRLLASAGADGMVRLWDPFQPEADPVILRSHEGNVLSVTFAPDGRLLASGNDDGTVRLWDLTNLAASPLVLEGHADWVYSVAFSPDGQLLATGSADSTARLWRARTETLADLVCTRVWRNLTLDEWRQFVGDLEQVPYQPTCPDLPSGESSVMATPSLSTPATPSASPAASEGTPVTHAATPVAASAEPDSGTGAAISGTTYTSPTYGFSLAWPEPWLATWEESGTGRDVLVLFNGVSGVRVEAGPGATGDAARCVQETAAQLRGEPGVSGARLLTGSDGRVLRGGDRSHAFAAFSFTETPAVGGTEERVRRLECRTLVPGQAVLLIQQDMPLGGHEEQMDALESLLNGLTLSGANSSSTDVLNPTSSEAATPAVAAADISLKDATPLPLPTPRVAVWSQEH